jgi:hypothetical protein
MWLITTGEEWLGRATIMRALVDEPQKAAAAICEWAAKTDQPTRALLAWARKHRAGTYGLYACKGDSRTL